jgi:hypothetical protein
MRYGWGGLEVGKDTDILKLLNKRSKHRLSHSQLLFVVQGARNSQNFWSKLRKRDWNYISVISFGPFLSDAKITHCNVTNVITYLWQ